jgi:hypothetical protein
MKINAINGSLPESIRSQYETLRGLSEQERQIERLYEPHSTTLICADQDRAYGSIRLIYKRNAVEKLPCEYARLCEQFSTVAPFITRGVLLEIPASPYILPVVEIGALSIEHALPLSIRSDLLRSLMMAAYDLAVADGSRIGFISCEIKPAIERLYRRFGFQDIAIISYDLITCYKLFYKYNTHIVQNHHPSRTYAQKI